MRRGLNWYKRNPVDFIGGVRGMTARQIAVYNVVVDLLYIYGGSIANDPKFIGAVFSDMGSAAVRNTIAELVALGKLQIEGDELTNARAKNETKTEGKPRKNSEKTEQKTPVFTEFSGGEPNKNNDLTPLDKIREDKKKPPDPLEGEFAEFWRAYPGRGKSANPKKTALKAFRAARKKADHSEIMAGLRACEFEPPGREQFNAMASTWLNQERWIRDESGHQSTTESRLEAQIREAGKAINNGTRILDSWFTHDVAAGLLRAGFTEQKLRGVGFNSAMFGGDGDGGGPDRGGSGGTQSTRPDCQGSSSGGEARVRGHREGSGGDRAGDTERSQNRSQQPPAGGNAFARAAVVIPFRAGEG